ncbi:hypothetical protein VTO42DRAFT_6701 [Malbranchea cinnamomea]
MNSNSQSQLPFPIFATTHTRPVRALRKFQSHQNLSSSPSSSSLNPPQPHHFDSQFTPHPLPESGVSSQQHLQNEGEAAPPTSRGRSRSNSDVTLNSFGSSQAPRRSRKSGSMGFAGKRSGLEILLRDGPPNNDVAAGLEELRYLILSSRVDADSDGMSPHRIYVWLALLNISPLPTDEYLSLVHRGRSPAYAKIRNDTFRTLATDPLFKRRVTEASLIRLLNAVAWKIHDLKSKVSSNQSFLPHTSRSKRLSSDFFPPIFEETSIADEYENNSRGSIEKSAIYVQGMNVLCAPFLYASRSEVEAFALFHHFVTRECPGYIRGTMDGVHRGLKLVDRCLEIVEPKLANYLFSRGMHAELYAFPSVLTLCACTPPLPEVLHLWDFLFAYGPHLNILCIVAQLIRMRDTILASSSPNKILRSLPPLNAKEIIALTVLIVRKIPDDLYEELVVHAK